MYFHLVIFSLKVMNIYFQSYSKEEYKICMYLSYIISCLNVVNTYGKLKTKLEYFIFIRAANSEKLTSFTKEPIYLAFLFRLY